MLTVPDVLLGKRCRSGTWGDESGITSDWLLPVLGRNDDAGACCIACSIQSCQDPAQRLVNIVQVGLEARAEGSSVQSVPSILQQQGMQSRHDCDTSDKKLCSAILCFRAPVVLQLGLLDRSASTISYHACIRSVESTAPTTLPLTAMHYVSACIAPKIHSQHSLYCCYCIFLSAVASASILIDS